MQLLGISINRYRSFSMGGQVVYPLTGVNLLAGQNNSGKSNVLRFIGEFLPNPHEPAFLDVSLGEGASGSIEMELAYEYEVAQLHGLIADRINQVGSHSVDPTRVMANIVELFGSGLLQKDVSGSGVIWIKYELAKTSRAWEWRISPALLTQLLEWAKTKGRQRSLLEAAIFVSNLTGDAHGIIAALLENIFPRRQLNPVASIEAFRRIQDQHQTVIVGASTTYNGSGLIKQLQRLERPAIGDLYLKEKFESINRFVRSVLDDESARIEIPSEADTVHVSKGGVVLPLDHLGTGIHQVVIIAAACTLLDNSIVCMEEPEIHLHPLLQRKLINYLKTETSNQYVIATHSAHLLDSSRCSVFHVRSVDNVSMIEQAATPHSVSSICADLGYRASDLLQSNAVIWVEGPSDRIYLKHWIESTDRELLEGIHYSIMFYGGSLLRHLSVDDREIEEFISLRRLNRHVAIMIDSDKRSARERVSETKREVRDAFARIDSPGFAWITNCRTIENYVPPLLLQGVVKEVHPRSRHVYDPLGETQWTEPLNFSGGTSPAKVRISRKVCEHWNTDQFDRWGLAREIKRCIEFIRRANDL